MRPEQEQEAIMDAGGERMQRYLGLAARIAFSGLPSLAMLYWMLWVKNVHSMMVVVAFAFMAPSGILFRLFGISESTTALHALSLAMAAVVWWLFFFLVLSRLSRLAALDLEGSDSVGKLIFLCLSLQLLAPPASVAFIPKDEAAASMPANRAS